MNPQDWRKEHDATAEELCDRFVAIIRAWLTPAELESVRAHPPTDQNCRTHDFCDPNQAMLYAWEGCFGRGDCPAFICDLPDDIFTDYVHKRDSSLVDRAWQMARNRRFERVPCTS